MDPNTLYSIWIRTRVAKNYDKNIQMLYNFCFFKHNLINDKKIMSLKEIIPQLSLSMVDILSYVLLRLPPINPIFTCVNPYSEYGSKKLLTTDPIWIRIYNIRKKNRK